MDWYRQPALASQLLFDRFDNVMRHKRLTIIFANVPVSVKAGFGPQVSGELAAEIVLNDDHLLAAREDAADFGGVEGNDPFDVKLVGHHTLFGGQLLDGFTNDTLG